MLKLPEFALGTRINFAELKPTGIPNPYGVELDAAREYNYSVRTQLGLFEVMTVLAQPLPSAKLWCATFTASFGQREKGKSFLPEELAALKRLSVRVSDPNKAYLAYAGRKDLENGQIIFEDYKSLSRTSHHYGIYDRAALLDPEGPLSARFTLGETLLNEPEQSTLPFATRVLVSTGLVQEVTIHKTPFFPLAVTEQSPLGTVPKAQVLLRSKKLPEALLFSISLQQFTPEDPRLAVLATANFNPAVYSSFDLEMLKERLMVQAQTPEGIVFSAHPTIEPRVSRITYNKFYDAAERRPAPEPLIIDPNDPVQRDQTQFKFITNPYQKSRDLNPVMKSGFQKPPGIRVGGADRATQSTQSKLILVDRKPTKPKVDVEAMASEREWYDHRTDGSITVVPSLNNGGLLRKLDVPFGEGSFSLFSKIGQASDIFVQPDIYNALEIRNGERVYRIPLAVKQNPKTGDPIYSLTFTKINSETGKEEEITSVAAGDLALVIHSGLLGERINGEGYIDPEALMILKRLLEEKPTFVAPIPEKPTEDIADDKELGGSLAEDLGITQEFLRQVDADWNRFNN